MSDYFEFVRKNIEQQWEKELRRIVEPAIDRCRADPGMLDDFPFSSLFSAVLAWGPGHIAAIAPRIVPLIRPAIVAKGAKRSKSVADLGVANLANLLACCGYPDETAPISDWLSEIETSSRDESTEVHWDRAFAALALDRRRLYRALAGEHPDEPLRMTPSTRFGGNLQGFLRQLGAAVETGAGFASSEPAWRDFVANLERHEDTRQVDRATPFWIARVVHHRIGGAPLGSVAQWLHDQIRDGSA